MTKKIAKKNVRKIVAKVKTVKEKPIKATVTEYAQTLANLKQQVQEAQVKAALSVNKELIKLYWSIGKTIVEKQEKSGWGTGLVEQLAKDLQNALPGIEGFSPRNIFRMQAFYRAYEKVTQTVSQIENLPIFKIPWGQNIVIFQQIKNNEERLWYAQKSIEHGWSRTMLEMQIESDLYKRSGKAITNFSKTLPSPHSDMAQQSLKDPYVFDFLTLHDDHVEHDIEEGLVNNVQKLLLELGKGFALIGRQYHLEVGDSDFYIDLLFYHTKLRCYVVVELKARKFDPRDAGQLNFYLSAVDDILRHPDDKPTIGLLLCKTKNDIVAEYALRDINKPIGIAGYQAEITKRLPKEMKSSLPTIKELEDELEKKQAVDEIVMKKKTVKLKV